MDGLGYNSPVVRRIFHGFGAAALLSGSLFAGGCSANWRTASRVSANIAPLPEQHPPALVQVYAARAFNWRGFFAVHTWIAVKEKGASAYTVYHLTGWRVRRGQDGRMIEEDIPDRLWYNNRPAVIAELKGPAAEAAIPDIAAAAAAYPHPRQYRVWPGPNSNTFISYILRRVPALKVELPPNAVGRNWLAGAAPLGRSESGTGAELSLYGLAGVTVGAREGVEVQLLGLTVGVDVLRPALKLPLIGRVGLRDR
jgi:hypothetical protein